MGKAAAAAYLGRFFAWAVAAAGLAAALYCLAVPPVFQGSGIIGHDIDSNGRPAFVVTSVQSGFERIVPQVRAGDTLVPRNPMLLYRAAAGTPQEFTLIRAGKPPRDITIVYPRRSANPAELIDNYVAALCSVIAFSVALLLLVLRSNDPLGRWLTAVLITLGCALAERGEPVYIAYAQAFLSDLALLIGPIALIGFATAFPHAIRRTGLRRALWCAGVVLAVPIALVGAWDIGRDFFDVPQPGIVESVGQLCGVALFVCVIAALLLAMRATTGAERQRVRWITASFALGLSGYAVSFYLYGAYWSLLELTLIAIPVGMAYAILRHRLLDLTFVLNRTLVYGALTTMLLPAFGILEWAADRYVSAENHTESVLLEVGIALTLFLSMRWLHARVEWLVDTLLFRQKHLDERAILELAEELPFISSRETLLVRVTRALREHAHASRVEFYRLEDDALDRDDRALLAVQAKRRLIDAPDGSSLSGCLIAPLASAGEITGIVACGSKENGETYDPDERAAIAALAVATGAALDRLSVKEAREEALRWKNEARRLAQYSSSAAAKSAE